MIGSVFGIPDVVWLFVGLGIVGLAVVKLSVLVADKALEPEIEHENTIKGLEDEIRKIPIRVRTVEGDTLEIDADELDLPVGPNLERRVEELTYDLETARFSVTELRRRLGRHHELAGVPADHACEVCS